MCAGTEGKGRSSQENCSRCTELFTLHRTVHTAQTAPVLLRNVGVFNELI